MFLIRADGNAQIGAGHLMRCMAVAEELALLVRREEICFICADEQSAALAGAGGFKCCVLGTDYQDMESELSLWRELAAKKDVQEASQAGKLVLLVDSYYVTDQYLKALRQIGYTVLLEDFGSHCYPVDCVINYNAHAKLTDYERLYQGQAVKLLVGSSYVPLRRQFIPDVQGTLSQEASTMQGEASIQVANIAPYKVREEARAVLITTGGGDSENIAGKILEEIYGSNLTYHLVIGQFNPHFQEMKALEETHGNIHIYHNVEDMAGLMGGCDMALTAGGSTVYELAAVGVPFICFSYAENQELLTEYIGREGIAGFAGAWHKDPGGTLQRMGILFRKLAGSRKMRTEYSLKEKAMIDGRGAKRLARALVREEIP